MRAPQTFDQQNEETEATAETGACEIKSCHKFAVPVIGLPRSLALQLRLEQSGACRKIYAILLPKYLKI